MGQDLLADTKNENLFLVYGDDGDPLAVTVEQRLCRADVNHFQLERNLFLHVADTLLCDVTQVTLGF